MLIFASQDAQPLKSIFRAESTSKEQDLYPPHHPCHPQPPGYVLGCEVGSILDDRIRHQHLTEALEILLVNSIS